MPELSVIIVNWNCLSYTRSSLASIVAGRQGLDLEVIVVDNASTKDDLDSFQTQFPDIKLIRSHVNLGFAGANNLGFEHSSGRYLLFLNPDTEVLNDALPRMVGHMTDLPEVGILGCMLLNSDRTIQTSCIQRFPTILNQVLDLEVLRVRWPGWKLWGIAPLFSQPGKPIPVEVITGACLMIRRDVFEQVGFFSREFFMYAEDVDLCYKVHQLGLKCYFAADARVVHHGGGSSKQKEGNQWATVMQRKAILQFCQKTRGPSYALLYRITIGLSALGRLATVMMVWPFRTARQTHQLHLAWQKWTAVSKWAFGFDHLTSSVS